MTDIALPASEISARRATVPQPRDQAPSALGRLGFELAVFAAVAALALAQWSRLLADPPAGRLIAALAVALAAAAALGALARGGPRGPRGWALGLVIGFAALAGSMAAIGWPAHMLAPGGWDELLDKLGLGLAGVEDVEMPYDGGDQWLRLTLLTGVPLGLVSAATFGFGPAGRRTAGRLAALVCVVALYGVAVTLDSPGAELAWGVPLLLCIVAWLWLPALPARRAAIAAGIAAATAIVVLPVAARVESGTAWFDYESWDWFGRDREISFQWNHAYGPLDWPRDGTTLLDVRSNEPQYWKASVLDRFDGFTWQRAAASDSLAAAERVARRRAPGSELPEMNRQWLMQASFEVEALESEVVIGTGTTMALQGAGTVIASRDGTLTPAAAGTLEGGDEYSLVAYVPRPTPTELRQAPRRYGTERFADQVLVGLPAHAGSAADGAPVELDAGGSESGFAPQPAIAMPLWGEREPEADATLAASPYSGVYDLARELTAGADHPYDATLAIERHLSSTYDYTPAVEDATYPLAAFLERDRAGYCQQFAGTMALMLRMVGIPSRVVSGFAPGDFDPERGVYEVRDYDAHAWVEVYFRGIGWVTFDPTPAAAPASRDDGVAAAGTGFRGRGAVPDQTLGRAQSLEAALEGGELAESPGGPGPWPVLALSAGAILAAGGIAMTALFSARRRALRRGALAEAQLAELRRAVGRMGWEVPSDATLLDLERRFGAAGRRAVARYAAELRAHRYTARAPAPPGPRARRALRRALAGGGLRRRLRALRAIPPGGPAVRAR